MEIHVEGLGRKYRSEWIFRGLTTRFVPDVRYVLVGPNGSGKSTLLKVISGQLTPTAGRIHYKTSDGKPFSSEDAFKAISYAAPYIELIEEMTLAEALAFHRTFKAFPPGIGTAELADILNLPNASHKEIRFFSSGMKQRLKLALALVSDTPILLVDEPSTNLDGQGVAWYMALLDRFAQGRVCIIASNDPVDIEQAHETVHILDYK